MENINTIDTTETTDLSILAALDALEANHVDAQKLLIGLPVTVSIGCDSYPYKIVSVTQSLKTIVVQEVYTFPTLMEGQFMTFRLGKKGFRSGKHYRLTLGEAIRHSPLES